MTRKHSLSLALIAIATAIVIVLSQITIPFGPVPFTLQTFAVGLMATLLKTKESLIAISLYILLGLIGFPVFSGGHGGISVLFGPTGGFIWGFIFYALITSLICRPNRSLFLLFIANLLGDGSVFLLGAVGFMLYNHVSFLTAFTVAVMPFILIDLVKIIAITFVSYQLFPILKKEAYYQ